MNYQEVTNHISNWIREKVEAAGAKGVVVGLSGGIDSCVVAAICKKTFPDTTIGVIMPCNSSEEDAEHGKLVAEKFSISVYTTDLSEAFTCLHNIITSTVEVQANQLTTANIKPRLRMTTLYYFAGLFNYLVAGTGNKSELEIGYFTKYGDGGVDIEPIGHLLKTEVRDLARYLGIPKEIIEKSPSAGLWEHQTDEAEMGITYEELDHYLLKNEATEKVEARINKLQKISEHKRHVPPVPLYCRLTKTVLK